MVISLIKKTSLGMLAGLMCSCLSASQQYGDDFAARQQAPGVGVQVAAVAAQAIDPKDALIASQNELLQKLGKALDVTSHALSQVSQQARRSDNTYLRVMGLGLSVLSNKYVLGATTSFATVSAVGCAVFGPRAYFGGVTKPFRKGFGAAWGFIKERWDILGKLKRLDVKVDSVANDVQRVRGDLSNLAGGVRRVRNGLDDLAAEGSKNHIEVLGNINDVSNQVQNLRDKVVPEQIAAANVHTTKECKKVQDLVADTARAANARFDDVHVQLEAHRGTLAELMVALQAARVQVAQYQAEASIKLSSMDQRLSVLEQRTSKVNVSIISVQGDVKTLLVEQADQTERLNAIGHNQGLMAQALSANLAVGMDTFNAVQRLRLQSRQPQVGDGLAMPSGEAWQRPAALGTYNGFVGAAIMFKSPRQRQRQLAIAAAAAGSSSDEKNHN